MTFKEFREIALHAAKKTAPANYTSIEVDQAFRDGLKELAGSVNQFMKNRYDIYDIMIEAADEVVPNKVIASLGMFAEIKQVGQGNTAKFVKRVGRNRAKKFLTQVGLSGVYETFRLDKATFNLAAHAVGGGATVDFERLMDGDESLSEVMEVLTEGITDAVFYEVHKAMRAALNATERPEANKVIVNAFDGTEMQKLCNTVRAYGDGVVIFATPEFVADMGPDAIVPALMNNTTPVAQGIYSPDDIKDIHNTGFIRLFRGVPVVQIPQSFIDETNTKTWIDPQIAYVLPTGKEKVVKVVLEGQTQINDFKNRDNSLEIYMYKKMGAAILTHYNWGIYQNSGVTQTFENPYNY